MYPPHNGASLVPIMLPIAVVIYCLKLVELRYITWCMWPLWEDICCTISLNVSEIFLSHYHIQIGRALEGGEDDVGRDFKFIYPSDPHIQYIL